MTWRIAKALRLGTATYALALSRDFAGEPVDVVAIVDVLSVHNPRVAELEVERVDGDSEHMRESAVCWLHSDGALEALLACSLVAREERAVLS